MRVRLALLLFALVALVAVPSDASLTGSSGSIVDQVASCVEPNAVARDIRADPILGQSCRDGAPLRVRVAVLLAVLGLAGLLQGAAGRERRRADIGWRPSLVAPRTSAPGRAPPLPV
jgi:hypothetical protein